MLLTLLAFLAAAPAPSKAERLDALDFDNGALLVSESGSYGTDVGAWSAWHLTDGDPALGWCSPQGKPLGGTLVWDLDSVWELDTFALSTENVEEEGYPGISAKSVELFVAPTAGSPFTKAGAFQVGRLKKASYPLKGVKAKRVKLVVTGNHGNSDFTEIAEIDLLGTRTAPSPSVSLSGDFETSYGPLRFAQEGSELYGCYDWASRSSVVFGSVSGRIARVTWVEDDGEGNIRQGTASFAVRSDGELWGVWYENGELQGLWAGPRTDTGPTCRPQKKGTISRLLQKEGRAVLFGIHFASDSDLPLPDSTATLEAVAQALKESAGLRVMIEGHTDSTNTDSYNLELSSRRAQAIADWLVKHGIGRSRLEAKGFGKSKPVADNRTAQGRSLNRRVEASVLH
jgi:outer membrane protein OmpA-like peptidoglycan-associated protein